MIIMFEGFFYLMKCKLNWDLAVNVSNFFPIAVRIL